MIIFCSCPYECNKLHWWAKQNKIFILGVRLPNTYGTSCLRRPNPSPFRQNLQKVPHLLQLPQAFRPQVHIRTWRPHHSRFCIRTSMAWPIHPNMRSHSRPYDRSKSFAIRPSWLHQTNQVQNILPVCLELDARWNRRQVIMYNVLFFRSPMQSAFLWAKNKIYHWFLNIFVASIALRIFVIKNNPRIVTNCRFNCPKLS